MRNILVDLHNHFLTPHAINFHVFAQKPILRGWHLLDRKVSIAGQAFLMESRLAAFVSLDVFGWGHSVRDVICWTEEEFLVLQTVSRHQILLLAENFRWGDHAALGFLEVVELELRIPFRDVCLLFWLPTRFFTLFQVFEQKSSGLAWLLVRPCSIREQLHLFLRNYSSRKVFGCHRPFFADTNAEILILGWQRAERIFVLPRSFLGQHVDIACVLSIPLAILQLGYWLRQAFIVFLDLLWIIELDLCLFCSEVDLVTLLCLNSPWHFNLPAIVRNGLISCELGVQAGWIHVLFHTVDDSNYVVDISLELFALLKRDHADQVGFLVGDRIKVPVMLLSAFDWTFTLLWWFWSIRLLLMLRILIGDLSFMDGGSLVLDRSQVTDDGVFLFPFVFKSGFNRAVSLLHPCYWPFHCIN